MLGQGFMGRAHSNAWRQAGRFFETPLHPVLHAVVARDAASLADFAERQGWAEHGTRWQALIDDPAVGLVDIGTPNDVHHAPAVAALAAGKHVACEKPLAHTLDAARSMHDAAKAAARKGVRSFVWFNYRRCPAVGLAWQLMREGRLGTVHEVRARYLQAWGGADTPRVWRFRKSRAGSGAHGDLNAHMVDMARFLLDDEIAEVHGAVARTVHPRRPDPSDPSKLLRSDVDDICAFLASFRGGATATFEASRVATGELNDNGLAIYGSDGALRFDFEDMNVLWLHEGPSGGRTSGWTRVLATSPEHHPWVDAWWPDAHVLGYEHGFTNMAADILRALGGEQPTVPLPDFADAWQTQRVLEAALRAAHERKAVRLSEVR